MFEQVVPVAQSRVLLCLTILTLLGCRAELKNDNGVDPNSAIAQVIITPPTTSIVTGQILQFQSYGITVAGESVSVNLDWIADGGGLLSPGTFSSAEAGVYHVIGRDKTFPNPSDTATVTVSSPSVTLTSLVVIPVAPILGIGESRPFVVEAHFSDSTIVFPAPVTWAATGGTIDPAGLYTAGNVVGAFNVIATSTVAAVAETVLVSISAVAPTVTQIVLAPDTATTPPGGSVAFQAFASYTDGTFAPAAVLYATSGGSITSGGRLTTSQTPGTYRVIATHQASGFADTSTVTVASTFLVSIALTPPTVTLVTGSQQQFAATGTKSDSSKAPVSVTFSATGGTISTGGLYTAGSTAGSFLVIARTAGGLADTSGVTINNPNTTLQQIRMQPATASLLVGSSQQFSVNGRLSDGTIVAVSVSYTATGGTISSLGLYTAPQVAGSYKVIARSTIANLADTSTVTVNSSITLTSITVSPSSATLITGGIQQFTATGHLSSGATTGVSVNWFANSGFITLQGQYTAPGSPGTAMIIATQQGGGFADTAFVTVANLPPPGSNACSNEPAGMSPVFDTPWSAIPPVAPATDLFGWKVRSQAELNKLSIISDPAAPRSAPSAIAGKFPRGAPGGSAPFRLDRSFGRNVTDIYVCVFTELDTLFTNNGNVAVKFGFFLTPYQSGTQIPNHYFNMTNNLGIQLQSTNAILNRNMLTSFSLIGHRGQWVKVEFLVQSNSLGNSDGVARMWINGTQLLNVTDVQYFYPSQQPAFNGITWNPTYGGGLNPVPYDQFQFLDHWYLSVK